MSNELILDTSQELFKLDKEKITFKIPFQNQLNDSLSRPKSDCIVTVTNLSNYYLSFRTRTTKKEEYAVNPAYTIIPPQSNFKIKLTFYNKSKELNPKSHKFKFEGIVINEIDKNLEPKIIFNNCLKYNQKVLGNSIKRAVEFSFVQDKEEKDFDFVNQIEEQNFTQNKSIYSSEPNEESSNTIKKVKIMNPNFNGKNYDSKNQKDELESLKVDYYKLKNQLNTLTENYNNLKNRVDMEKRSDIPNIKQSSKLIYLIL